MAARRLMPGGRGVAERRRDELSASPLRRGASTQTSWTSSAQVHKRLRGGRYRTGNAIYELQFLGDLWSVEIKASDLPARRYGVEPGSRKPPVPPTSRSLDTGAS